MCISTEINHATGNPGSFCFCFCFDYVIFLIMFWSSGFAYIWDLSQEWCNIALLCLHLIIITLGLSIGTPHSMSFLMALLLTFIYIYTTTSMSKQIQLCVYLSMRDIIFWHSPAMYIKSALPRLVMFISTYIHHLLYIPPLCIQYILHLSHIIFLVRSYTQNRYRPYHHHNYVYLYFEHRVMRQLDLDRCAYVVS